MADARRPTRAATNPELANDANPTGDPKKDTGPVGTPEVVDAQEHVLGDDPRRVEAQEQTGFHDALSGRPVTQTGHFVDPNGEEGPIPPHRIVADQWPTERAKLDDPAQRTE